MQFENSRSYGNKEEEKNFLAIWKYLIYLPKPHFKKL